ncbi:protein kinase domain-containing protein [Streptomyces sp. NPDC054940]
MRDEQTSNDVGTIAEHGHASAGLQLLDALEAVHAAGTLHRDVKPANVLLRPDGNTVLADLGIAALDDGESLTTTGELVGSLEYMAPERVMDSETSPASDLWSMGATLATVCAGQSPFRRPARPATLHAVTYEDPGLSERLGPLRPVVEALCSRPRTSALRRRVRVPHCGAWQRGRQPTSHCRRGPCGCSCPHSPWPTRHSDQWAGEAHPRRADRTTAQHATSVKPSQHHPSHTAEPKRLVWALAGTAVLAAVVVGGLFLTGTLPLKEDPKTTTTSQVVQSANGWQPVTGVSVQRGDRVTVRFRRVDGRLPPRPRRNCCWTGGGSSFGRGQPVPAEANVLAAPDAYCVALTTVVDLHSGTAGTAGARHRPRALGRDSAVSPE